MLVLVPVAGTRSAFADGANARLPEEITATLLDFDAESVHYESLVEIDP